MDTKETAPMHNFSLDSFQKAHKTMIATSENASGYRHRSYWNESRTSRLYSNEEVSYIITSGSLAEQQKLSRNYFNIEGYYSQIILHYATLLIYSGLLIPNPALGKNLSTPHISKRYYAAVDYVEKMGLKTLLTNCAIRALIDGCYYGIVANVDKDNYALIDLPAEYCRSRFKDGQGNDIIELNLSYFNTFDQEDRVNALAAFPRAIAKAYREWDKGKVKTPWFIVPNEIAVCFPITDGRPPFLSVIPATIKYGESIELDVNRNKEEVHKIIVQKIPHLNDGRLLFEPEEALEMHNGAVGMLKGNPNVNVLTTYADVDSIASKSSTEGTKASLEIAEKNIYAQAGTSGELFTASGSSALNASIKNDIAFMMILANKFARYITNLINQKFSNGNITFKYIIFPISHHNSDAFLDSTHKLASSGYSFLMPILGLGLTQKDFGNLKDLENNVLELGKKMIPPQTSYTQTSSEQDGDGTSIGAPSDKNKTKNGNVDEGGRPNKQEGQKADTTIAWEESIDRNGGGS